MTIDELKRFLPRKSGVVLEVIKKNKSGIILPGQSEHDITTHTYKVFSKGPNVVDLEEGEEVYPMTAVLGKLEVNGVDEHTSYYYCEDSFIKLHRVVSR